MLWGLYPVLGAEGGITLIPSPERRVGPLGRTTAPWWSREVVQAARDSPRPNESISVLMLKLGKPPTQASVPTSRSRGP